MKTKALLDGRDIIEVMFTLYNHKKAMAERSNFGIGPYRKSAIVWPFTAKVTGARERGSAGVSHSCRGLYGCIVRYRGKYLRHVLYHDKAFPTWGTRASPAYSYPRHLERSVEASARVNEAELSS